MDFRQKPKAAKNDYHDAFLWAPEWSAEGDLKLCVRLFASVRDTEIVFKQVVNRTQVEEELAECLANRGADEIGQVSSLHAERLPTGGQRVRISIVPFHIDDRDGLTIVCKGIDEW